MFIIKQVFWGIKADFTYSYPVPPRLLIGWYTSPITGSTSLYRERRGCVYDAINPRWTQINIVPRQWSKELGECFSLYVLGKWRTVVYGDERTTKVLSDGDAVHEVMPYEIHVHPYLMSKENKERAINFISRSLSHDHIVRFAFPFSQTANAWFDYLLDGSFKESPDINRREGPSWKSVCISAQSLRFYSLGLVEGPLFEMKTLCTCNQHENEGDGKKNIFESFQKSQKGTLISLLNTIEHRFDGRFKMNPFSIGFRKRALHAMASCDKMLHDHINKMAARLDIQVESVDCLYCKNIVSERRQDTLNEKTPVDHSLLVDILRTNKCSDQKLHMNTIADIAGLLWIEMYVGNAWTEMALLLMQQNSAVFLKVRDEIDKAATLSGPQRLFHESSLSRMTHLDALIFEAIRLCPPFCGGLWTINKTVLFDGDEVQIPASSHVIIDQTENHFNLADAVSMPPHQLGESYPNQYLHGYHSLNGLEVPTMVLQTKIFLVTFLIRCDFSHRDECLGMKTEQMNTTRNEYINTKNTSHEDMSSDEGGVMGSCILSCYECRNWFSKNPFPHSMRAINVRKRPNNSEEV